MVVGATQEMETTGLYDLLVILSGCYSCTYRCFAFWSPRLCCVFPLQVCICIWTRATRINSISESCSSRYVQARSGGSSQLFLTHNPMTRCCCHRNSTCQQEGEVLIRRCAHCTEGQLTIYPQHLMYIPILLHCYDDHLGSSMTD